MSEGQRHDGDAADLAGLTGLYALDALEHDAREQFESFLVNNPDALAEVAEFRATAEMLAASVALQPPAHLRASVLSGVSDIRQDAVIIDLRDRTRRRNRTTWLAVAAVAVVLAGAMGGVLGSRSSGPPTDEVAAFLSRSDARVVPLSGGAAVGAKVIWSASAGQAMVVTTGSVKLTDDQTYELWRIDGANASPVGVFRPDADGNVRTSFQADLNGAGALGVTVEPAGGSDTPTLPVVLSGAVPA